MARSFTPCVSLVVAVAAGSACGSPTEPGNNNGGQTNPPTITCPAAPAPVPSPNGQPVPVQYGTAIATGTGVTVTCSPSSGSAFAVGTTTVVCTAFDSAGRSAACGFTVAVQSAPRISLTRFAAFGDSITWGEDGTNQCSNSTFGLSPRGPIHPHQQLPTAQQYPTVLQTLLQGRYVGQTITVRGLGVQGEGAGTPEAQSRFVNDVVNSRSYDAVLLMEGANDINRYMAPDAGISGLGTMIQAAKANGIRPFLATIPPELAGGPVYTLDPVAVQSFNGKVRSLAAAQSVTLVDIEAAFGASPRQYLSCDFLHPNPSGYQLIANTFFTVLTQTLEVRTSTTTFAVPVPARPRSQPRPRP